MVFAQFLVLSNVPAHIVTVFPQFFPSAKNEQDAFSFPSLLGRVSSAVVEQGGSNGKALQLGCARVVAQCVAAAARGVGKGKEAAVDGLVQQCLAKVSSQACCPAEVQFSLLVLGEIGKLQDLSQIKGLEQTIFATLLHIDDDLRASASLALGGVACGQLKHFVPLIVQAIRKEVNLRQCPC